MLLMPLDRDSSVSAYLQIRDRVVRLVDEGTLRPGDRLPTSRALAESLGVHRSTVVRAYEEVRALGYLESRSGSYTTVRRRARPPAISVRGTGQGLIDWNDLTGRPVRRAHELTSTARAAELPEGVIDFERLAADPKLAPVETLRRCLRTVLQVDGPSTLDYADPGGWEPLRESISNRMRAHGVAVTSDEIVVTNGAQQALDLVLRLLTRPGDRIVVEAPTYSVAHALLRLHGVEAIEITMRDDGMDLDALEAALERIEVKLVYTMPNFHNPTGVTTEQAHRERLLALCERRRVPILEDGFEEEMKYFGRAVLPIKSIDARGVVLYVGTFSKVVFPGLRVGWIAAPLDAIQLLTSIQHASCLAGNTLVQAAAERFCGRGEFEAYLRRAHRIYRRRMQTMLEGLERFVPAGVRWTRPSGGYTVWLTLPSPGGSEGACCERLARAGVRVAPGSRFFGAPAARAHLRLSVACVAEEEILEGCRRLGEVLTAPL